MKILKKLTALLICIITAAAFPGCSEEKTMTAEDIALQKSMQGFWAASESTGYNQYDENGEPTYMIVVEFTDDLKYFLHECYISEGYVMTASDPVTYTIEDETFKTYVDGKAMYAGVSISDDGNTMYWINDDSTETYEKITDEEASELGIVKYDKETWESSRAAYESSSLAAEESNGESAVNTDSSEE